MEPSRTLVAAASAALFLLHCSSGRPLYRAGVDAFSLRHPPPRRRAHLLEVPEDASSATRFEALRRAFALALARDGVPGGALAVVEHGALTFATGVGVRGHGQSAPMTEATRVRIGSIHKTVVALAVMRAVQEGRLTLDSSIVESVPYFARGPGYDAGAVTLRMLLQHTAGLPDFGGGPAERAPESLQAYFTQHARDPLWAPPGRLHNYSNANYALAAAALEARSGRPLRELLREQVFAPAGMRSATYDPDEIARGEHASGYLAGMSFGPALESDRLTAAGGAYLDVRDLARLGVVLLHEGAPVVSRESYAQMRGSSVATGQRFHLRYGLGLMLATVRGHACVFHGGSIFGEQSLLLTVPDEGFAVALSANATFNPGDLGRAAIELFLHDRPDEPDEPERPLAAYTGEFEDRAGALGRFRVSVAGSGQALWLQPTGGQRVPFPGELAGTFFFDALGRPEYFATRGGVGRLVR